MKFTEFTKLSYGTYGRGIALTLPGGEPVRFQIPRLYAPFGLSGFPNKYGPTKYNIDLSMRGWNENQTYVNKFYEFLTTLEEQVIQHVRGLGILGPSPEENFNSNIKFSTTHDPRFRLKIDKDTLFFDADNNNITPSELEDGFCKGKAMTALVELKNVYFFNEKMGLTWTIVDAKVYEPKIPQAGPRFIEGGDDDEPVKVISGFQFQ